MDDLAAVALLLGALLLLASGRPRSGMAVLGLAAMTKGFPLVVAPVARIAWEEVPALPASSRGDGGFGSTGAGGLA